MFGRVSYFLLALNLSYAFFPGVVLALGDNSEHETETGIMYARSKRAWNGCPRSSIGDGWCDHACNTVANKFDGGDCCKATCQSKLFHCGSGGYDCKQFAKTAVWFLAYTKLCYQWYPDGNGGQCGGGEPRHLCAPVNSETRYYRDDTDNRGGGCHMSWGIESPYSPPWFRRVQICYRWYPDGNGGQCGGGVRRELCASVNKYTPVYRDDTDNRGGGCQMSWKIKLPSVHHLWARKMKLCFRWRADSNNGQCGHAGTASLLCAKANSWTPYYRDDTDNRGGGCRMRWGIYI